MNIIVDTSVIIAVIAGEPERDILIAQTKGADLLAPPSVHWEIGNALSAMLKRKRISLTKALEAIVAYQQIPIRSVDVDLEDALQIADVLDIYAYDAYLIQAALEYQTPLISLDTYLIECAGRMNASVIEVNRW
jgi:predicted nucleic acid-binding protein